MTMTSLRSLAYSLTRAMQNGHALGSDANNNITLTTTKTRVLMDRRIKTPGGWVGGVEIIPDVERFQAMQRKQQLEIARALVDSSKTVDVNALHCALTHPLSETTRATAAANGWTLTGEASTCMDCALAKAKQRNVSKTAVVYSDLKPGDMLMLDISSPGESLDKNKHMCLVLDAKSARAWVYILV